MAQGSKAQQIKLLRQQGKKAEADLLARGGATEQQKFQNRSRQQGNVAGGGRYIVQPGDSYFSIAGNVYGDQRYFEQLQLYNPYIKNLKPGMAIRLPRFEI